MLTGNNERLKVLQMMDFLEKGIKADFVITNQEIRKKTIYKRLIDDGFSRFFRGLRAFCSICGNGIFRDIYIFRYITVEI